MTSTKIGASFPPSIFGPSTVDPRRGSETSSRPPWINARSVFTLVREDVQHGEVYFILRHDETELDRVSHLERQRPAQWHRVPERFCTRVLTFSSPPRFRISGEEQLAMINKQLFRVCDYGPGPVERRPVCRHGFPLARGDERGLDCPDCHRHSQKDHMPMQRQGTVPLQDQGREGTCYAHAVARVATRFIFMYGLYKHRAGAREADKDMNVDRIISDREDCYNEILESLKAKYGKDGAVTPHAMNWLLLNSRFFRPDAERMEVEHIHVNSANVEKIRTILNTGRSLVASFFYNQGPNKESATAANARRGETSLDGGLDQWSFFYQSSSDILAGEIRANELPPLNWGGHAVVLSDIADHDGNLEGEGRGQYGQYSPHDEPRDSGPRFVFKNSWGDRSKSTHAIFSATRQGLCPDAWCDELFFVYDLRYKDGMERPVLCRPVRRPYVVSPRKANPGPFMRPHVGFDFPEDDWRSHGRYDFSNKDAAFLYRLFYRQAVDRYKRERNDENLRNLVFRKKRMACPSFSESDRREAEALWRAAEDELFSFGYVAGLVSLVACASIVLIRFYLEERFMKTAFAAVLLLSTAAILCLKDLHNGVMFDDRTGWWGHIDLLSLPRLYASQTFFLQAVRTRAGARVTFGWLAQLAVLVAGGYFALSHESHVYSAVLLRFAGFATPASASAAALVPGCFAACSAGAMAGYSYEVRTNRPLSMFAALVVALWRASGAAGAVYLVAFVVGLGLGEQALPAA